MSTRCLPILAALLWLATSAAAVPAAPGWHPGRAAGRSFEFRLVGDEFVNWAVARDGHTLLRDARGVWRHARLGAGGGLTAEGPVYDPAAPAGDSRGLRPAPAWLADVVEPRRRQRDGGGAARRERVEGTWNLLLILIHYPDQAPVVPPAGFDAMMNQSGWQGTGSFNDYYQDMSYGRFGTVSTVTAWVEAVHEHDYYGYNQGWNRSQELVVEAVTAVDAEVDFSQFDNTGDGTVDGLLIVHSGHGAEEGDGSNIWSHRWALWGQELELDGVTVSDYTMQPELQGGVQSAIGVYVHEFGHALNLPDLYDTDYSSSGVGNWCVMSGGSWGGGGNGGNAHVPSAMSAWCRQALGWSTVTTTATELADYGLPAVHLADEVLRLDLDGHPGQYFLMENRRRAAWDRHQPAEGLYIWHVDENQDGNSEDDHYLVDLEQADGHRDLNQGLGSDAGDIFPGATNNRRFDSQSQPSSLPYGGGGSTVSVTDIGDPADTLRASFFQTFSHQDLAWTGLAAEETGGGDLWPDPGEELWLTIELYNHGADVESLDLRLEAADPGVAVLTGEQVMGPVPGDVAFLAPPFLIRLDEDLPVGSYALSLHSEDASGWEQVTEGRLQVGRAGILLVLDGADASLAPWWEAGLAGGPAPEVRPRPADAPAPADLDAYPVVLWSTAAAAAPLDAGELGAFAAHLAGGGRLLISGQRLLDGLDEAGRALLGADPGPDWPGPALLRGLSSGGLVADGESILLFGAGGAWNQELPAAGLAPRPGSTPVARWGTGTLTALLRRAEPAWGGGRLLVAGASLEAVHGGGSTLDLEELLGRLLAWLADGSEVGVAPSAPAPPAPAGLSAWPNPFNPATRLRLDLPRDGQATLRIWNLAGALVRHLDLGWRAAGTHELALDLAGGAAGLYLAELRGGGDCRAVTRLLLLK